MEVEVLQSLAILEYLVLNNAKGRILEKEDVLIVHEQDLSQIEEANQLEEVFMAFSEKVPKFGK